MNRKSEEIKEKQISEVMASIENRVRHAYNQGYEQGLKDSKQEPCEDCISRQAVLNSLEELKKSPWYNEDYFGHKMIREEAFHIIKDYAVRGQPSVRPACSFGHWIVTDDDFVYCSECEDSYYPRPIDASWCYCPHCGAKMEYERRLKEEDGKNERNETT